MKCYNDGNLEQFEVPVFCFLLELYVRFFICGYPKITAQLKRNNVQVGSKRVWKLMNLMGIRSITMRKYRHYKSRETIGARDNILNRQFSTPAINQKWTADITYIKTKRNGWTYLASILDLKSRKIIGWSYGRKMTTQLVIISLERAMENQGYPEGVLIHSDMGSQYTSDLFTAKTADYNMIQSYSKKGCPYDNASIESFHGILKREEVNLRTYQDYYTAKNALFDFIEGWYSREDDENYHNILKEIDGMSKLVHDLLEISTLESGEVPLKLTPIHLSDLVMKVYDHLKHFANDKTLKTTLLLEDVFIVADEEKMEHVIQNILNNAIQYTSDGGEVLISMVIKNDTVTLCVENSPANILEDDLDKLWEPFYRGENSRNKLLGGTGLGLHLVKEILAKHDFKAYINNTEKGVKISFEAKIIREDMMYS